MNTYVCLTSIIIFYSLYTCQDFRITNPLGQTLAGSVRAFVISRKNGSWVINSVEDYTFMDLYAPAWGWVKTYYHIWGINVHGSINQLFQGTQVSRVLTHSHIQIHSIYIYVCVYIYYRSLAEVLLHTTSWPQRQTQAVASFRQLSVDVPSEMSGAG